jgi:hypothetical protein
VSGLFVAAAVGGDFPFLMMEAPQNGEMDSPSCFFGVYNPFTKTGYAGVLEEICLWTAMQNDQTSCALRAKIDVLASIRDQKKKSRESANGAVVLTVDQVPTDAKKTNPLQ